MYRVKREGFAGTWTIYFQDNVNDSPKWTTSRSKAAVFATEDEAMLHANQSGLYTIILEKVDDDNSSKRKA
jgi:hypothetical protein